MKVSEMAQFLCSKCKELEEDAEILIEDEDGWLHEFTIEDMEETFDGFYTATPAGLKLKMNKS